MTSKNSSNIIDTKAELTELIKLKMEKAVSCSQLSPKLHSPVSSFESS